jgi:6-phosphogluconate dehydrogenase
MQLVAEVYSILKVLYDMNNEDIAQFFTSCNERHALRSYLLEITATILRTTDTITGESLVDKILDVPRMNGTGAWTAKETFDSLVSCPSIIAAIDSRIVASRKLARLEMAHLHPGGAGRKCSMEQIENVMIMAMHMCYLQGFELIRTKSKKEAWGVDLSALARNWMGGCIIRSSVLDVFGENRDVDDYNGYIRIVFEIFGNQFGDAGRNVVAMCVEGGVYTPVLSATYQYILGHTTDTCSANLIQAQRDYFGSHGYQRVDMRGTFHTEWQKMQ